MVQLNCSRKWGISKLAIVRPSKNTSSGRPYHHYHGHNSPRDIKSNPPISPDTSCVNHINIMSNLEEGESPHVINISLSSNKEKYTGMGSAAPQSNSTLEEPVLQTIVQLTLTKKRDIVMIYTKVLAVFQAKSDETKLDELRRNCKI